MAAVKKRPCRVCRKWFKPDPRAGDRQRTCSAASCQRERHRQACAAWRAAEHAAEQGEKVAAAVTDALAPEGGSEPVSRVLRLVGVRDAVPLEVSIMIGIVLRVVVRAVRDAVVAEVHGIAKQKAKESRDAARDEMAARGRPP